jgi:hypothetical protein
VRWGDPGQRLTDDEQLDELLARCVDDWLQPADVFDIARYASLADEEAYVEQAIRLLAALVERGLTLAGDVVDGRHRPWPVEGPEAVDRVAAVWRADHDAAPLGHAVWLDATPSGLARGREVLAREEGLDDRLDPAVAARWRRQGGPGSDDDRAD